MSTPRPWRSASQLLPPELTRALGAPSGEPTQADLQALASRLSGALGVPLAAPPVAPVSEVTAAAAKTAWSIGTSLWVGGAVGVGLSTVLALSFPIESSPKRATGLTLAKSVAVATPSAAEGKSTAPPAVTPPRLVPTVSARAVNPASSSSVSPLAVTESELSLLGQARSALAHDPSRALALCDEHGRSFRNGALVQEREVIAIDALVRSGRLREARERARRFRLEFPSSAHAPRLATLLGNAAVE